MRPRTGWKKCLCRAALAQSCVAQGHTRGAGWRKVPPRRSRDAACIAMLPNLCYWYIILCFQIIFISSRHAVVIIQHILICIRQHAVVICHALCSLWCVQDHRVLSGHGCCSVQALDATMKYTTLAATVVDFVARWPDLWQDI